jgi:hypothetical protein
VALVVYQRASFQQGLDEADFFLHIEVVFRKPGNAKAFGGTAFSRPKGWKLLK